MGSVSWTVLLICFLTGGTLFFSVNVISLRIFSRARLHEAFRATNKEKLAEQLAENSEKLVLACSIYRLILNMCILLLLLVAFMNSRQESSQGRASCP